MAASPCFVCGAEDGAVFFEATGVPAHCNLLWATREEALDAPTADVRLALCPRCGLIYNERFEPERMSYVEGYETSLHFSGTFRAYAEEQAERLVTAHGLQNKDLVEIGCGAGDFLRLLCRLGANRGVGIDPSHAGLEEDLEGGGSLRIVAEPYTEAWADQPADLVVSRHVLEHLHEPLKLLGTLRHVAEARPELLVFFEVPNALYTLREGGIWDVIYEHCSYFTPPSLAAAFDRAGFLAETVDETYGGQFLTIEARKKVQPASPPPDHPGGWGTAEGPRGGWGFGMDVAAQTAAFGQRHTEKVAAWRTTLDETRAAGHRLAIWGAGSKGVTFLNTFPDHAATLGAVCDLNPRKQGRFVPGTGQRIVAPEELRADPPDAVIVMNPVYEKEIREALAQFGLNVRVLTA